MIAGQVKPRVVFDLIAAQKLFVSNTFFKKIVYIYKTRFCIECLILSLSHAPIFRDQRKMWNILYYGLIAALEIEGENRHDAADWWW